MKDILLKNIKRLPELTKTESNLAILLGTYKEGECPSNRELAKKMNLKERTIQKAMRTLRKKDMI